MQNESSNVPSTHDSEKRKVVLEFAVTARERVTVALAEGQTNPSLEQLGDARRSLAHRYPNARIHFKGVVERGGS